MWKFSCGSIVKAPMKGRHIVKDGGSVVHPNVGNADGFGSDSIVYPQSVLSKWSKQEIYSTFAAKQFIEKRNFNKKYYTTNGYTDNEVDLVVTRTWGYKPKMTLDELKALRKNEVRSIARGIYEQFDRYTLRYQSTLADSGTETLEIPANVKEYIRLVRLASKTIKAIIEGYEEGEYDLLAAFDCNYDIIGGVQVSRWPEGP